MHSFYLISPGPRPPYHSVAERLWGAGCDIDSDGDSDTPDSSDWTELTLILRSGPEDGPRVDVDPLEGPSLILWIRSDEEALAARAPNSCSSRPAARCRGNGLERFGGGHESSSRA